MAGVGKRNQENPECPICSGFHFSFLFCYTKRMAGTGFTRKKVASLTLGEKLKKIRSEYRISLNEVYKNTKIQVRYLEYLENGEYEKLPPDVYVRGFVRSYAHFLGADENVLVKLYERERNIQKNLKKEHFHQEDPKRKFSLPKFVITPGALVGSGIFVLVLGSFFYLYREFRAFAAVPYLVVVEPADGQVIEGSETYVHGKTDKSVRLFINDQPTLVRDDGSFSERVSLQPGLNTLTIAALNTFEKEERKVVTVQARYEVPQTEAVAEGDSVATVAEKISVELFVKEEPTRISVKSDGSVVYSGVLAPATNQVFEASEKIEISSEDGGRTFVSFNGGEAEVLGEVGQKVSDQMFGLETSAATEQDGKETEEL